MATQHIDVFNGDADGITALIQLHLAKPRQAQLVTGVKRDIKLLDRVSAGANTKITVLDIALEKNAQEALRLLGAGAEIFYCDHHNPGDGIAHCNLQSIIETSAEVCTSLLINGYLDNAFPEWAVVGAFGDNLKASATKLAKHIGLSEAQTQQLEQLGIAINYNGYGPSVDALHFDPAELFNQLVVYKNPLDMIESEAPIFTKLLANYRLDMDKAASVAPLLEQDNIAVFELPDEAWALRVSGVFGNELANQYPERAHAILSTNQQGGYQISVRAPMTNKMGADTLCMQFKTGGGRKGAAGINHLPKKELDDFIAAFNQQYS